MTDEKDEIKYSSHKEVSETYHISLDSHRCQWARITINETGDFNAITDCGNFNYAWHGYGGGSFKEFLVKIFSRNASGKGSYVYDKISDDSRSRVNCKETIAPMWKDFIEKYRELYKDKRSDARIAERLKYSNAYKAKWAFDELREKARSTRDVLKSIEEEGELSSDRFYSLMWDNAQISDLFFDGDYIAHCLDVEMTGDRHAIAFCEVVAPVFAEILRQELKEEPVTAAS
ncbi:hypothetical protein SAMN02799624_05281 [Paenibacillus sp. UNC496MF]|uniref:hypothetical protein n=1 Tax=Paenibacillus sp. UNC496MF TaxID=1502753 RepID=UPI0008EF64E7|nr:hypothetical protein [Paenibacillus sp. UNC496MF]SFJ63443.1 hypothetical protein SAMN02799624_05281 [Paenibacillus sp. UNC496MF]